MKKIFLFVCMLLIIYLSNTPNLYVSNPETWINHRLYEKGIHYTFVFNIKTEFYRPYSNVINKEFILHKLGHMSAYSFLTYLAYINTRRREIKLRYIWIFVTFFALTDEYHQFFIVGRTGRLIDVVLDSSISLILLLIIKLNKNKEKKRIIF